MIAMNRCGDCIQKHTARARIFEMKGRNIEAQAERLAADSESGIEFRDCKDGVEDLYLCIALLAEVDNYPDYKELVIGLMSVTEDVLIPEYRDQVRAVRKDFQRGEHGAWDLRNWLIQNVERLSKETPAPEQESPNWEHPEHDAPEYLASEASAPDASAPAF